jgi:outer membrane receptor protein involved in Fe transport
MRTYSSLRLICLLSLLPLLAFGQGSAASVTGLVSDPSGSFVPDAKVMLKNRATAVESRTLSTSAGVFAFPSVKIGEYDLEVEANGFRKYISTALRVETASATRVNVVLQVGSVSESVSVNAELPILQSETSSVGTVVNRALLDKVPFQLSGTNRDVLSFMRLVPGVAGNVGNFNVIITGGRLHTTEFLVDGVTNNYRGGIASPFSIRPSMTSVSEFRVETAVPPAEYGRTSSGVVIMSTKSGTNEYHGNLEFLIRNNVFDSRRFNARIADVTRQFETAANVGGPVIIPKLYNGKNRTFFFTDATLFRRINLPQGVTRTIATAAMRNGDFSAFANPIFDPLSGGPGQPRTQFVGNRIPANRITGFGRAALGTIPAPNLPTAENNFIGAARNIEKMTVFLMKIDHRFNDKHLLTASGRPSWNTRDNYNGPYAERLEGFYDLPYAPQITVNHDYIIRPNLLNKATFGYVNWFSLFLQTPSIDYKVPGAYGAGFPALRFTGQGLSMIGENVDRTVGSNNFNFQDALSWTTGRHNFKFGMRYDWLEDNTQTLGNQNGTYTFSPFTSGQPGVSASGHAFASLLLGAPTTANMQLGLPLLGRSQSWGFFAQDDWKLSQRLTLNLGLRYEIQKPFYDHNGNTSNLDLNAPNPLAGGRPGIAVFSGQGTGRSGRRESIDNYFGAWGPRVGLSYRVLPNTVFRAGFGLFYPPRIVNVITEGFSSNITLSSLDGGNSPAFYLDQGWPAGVAVQPPFVSPTLVNGRAASFANPDSQNGSGRLSRTYQTQVSIQQRIRSALLEVGWVSTQARHIPNSSLENLNQVDSKYLSLGDLLRRSITDPSVVAAGYRVPYAGFTGTLAQALRPYPQFQNINYVDSPSGSSSYHALLVKYEQRFSSGLAVLASYTHSKFLSDVVGAAGRLQDVADRRVERTVTTSDIPHRFVGSVAYELPFGKGKPFLNRGPAAWILGGFSFSGIFTYESGNPLTITNPNGLPIFNGTLRPNLVAGVDPSQGLSHNAFRPLNALSGERGDVQITRAAFAIPAANSFGNLGQNLGWLRSFGFANEDISLAKRVYFTDRQFFELRTDWFNAPNRSQLGAPNTDLTSVNFGRITGQKSARVIQFGVRYAF